MELNFIELFTQFKPLLVVLIAYFLGSIPTSVIIGKLFFKTDIRTQGSGNTGATNALRTLGVKVGIVVLIIDLFKGVAAILIAKSMMQSDSNENTANLVVALSGMVVIIGHVFSIWLGFKGGKGVATAAGVFIALMPLNLLFCLVLFVGIVAISKYVSLGSIIAVTVLFLIELISQYLTDYPDPYRLILVGSVTTLILIRHKANIDRLINGNENKFSFKKKPKSNSI